MKARGDCSKLLWKTTEEDPCKQVLSKLDRIVALKEGGGKGTEGFPKRVIILIYSQLALARVPLHTAVNSK